MSQEEKKDQQVPQEESAETNGVPVGGSPKEKCEAAHVGQAGYCDDAGNWHPLVK